MIRRSPLVALALLIGLGTSGQAVETYDLLPADALGGIACRNISDLVGKSDKLARDVGLKLPVTAGGLCQMAQMALGINAGLDLKGGCALVAANPKHVGMEFNFRNANEFLVVVLPFTDLDTMAANFGFDKGKLKSEKIAPVKMERDFIKFCYVRGKHIYLGIQEKAILSVAKGKSVGADLSPAQRKSLAEADCLCHLGVGVWVETWKKELNSAADLFGDIKNEADRQTAKELMQALAAVRHVFCTCKLGGGFGCGCMCVFPKDGGDAKKLLAALRGGEGGSSLRGLADGNVVAATAIHGDGSKNGRVLRVLFHLLVRDLLVRNEIYGAGDRPAILAVFRAIWPRLQGSRFALYKTADERKLGLFSLVAVLDVEDGAKFVNDLKTLARFGSAEGLDLTSEAGKEKTAAEIEQLVKSLGSRTFRARESATAKLLLAGEQVLPFLEKGIKSTDLEVSRRAERIKAEIVQAARDRRKELLSGKLTRAIKPSFAFLDKKEKVGDHKVFNVAVKLRKQDAATAPQLRQLFGPDWTRVRVGVEGKHVVVLLGSDVKLLSAALGNLKDGKPGLAKAAALGEQAKRIDPGRKIEVHASLALAYALATAADLEKPGKLPANPPLSTAALTIEQDRLQGDLWLPLAELKEIVRIIQQKEKERQDRKKDG
jgi:hypothetical protein